jgi:hypothetical protein
MKLSKISLAVAAVAAFASGSSVFAGQIGSSSVTLATEVIKTDAQQIRAPSTVYSFAGDIDARTNAQTLQLQYKLSDGRWASGAAGAFFTAANTSINAAALLTTQYVDGANAVQNALPAGSTVNGFLSADFKTLVLNITIPATAGATGLIKTPAFTINAGAFPAANAGLQGMFTVSGAAACPAPDKSASINFKHFATHNGQTNTDIITTANLASEHLRTGSTNDAEYVRFVQNHAFTFAAATNASRTDPAFASQRLVGNNFPTAVITGTQQLTLPAAVLAPITAHYLGKITLVQRAQGRDLDYAAVYGAGTTPADFLVAGDFTTAAAALTNGQVEVEANAQSLVFTWATALPAGSVLRLFNASGGAAVVSSAATAAGATTITINLTAAQAAGFAQPSAANFQSGAFAYLEYPGTGVIPQDASVAVRATLDKSADAGGTDQSEQDVVCNGVLAGVGGGIRVDIRNYASFAKFGATGPQSVVRLINNSESTSAEVFAQMIYADGKYGPYGRVATLAPREVVNLTNQQLEALMTSAAPAANPFSTSTVYTSEAGAAVSGTAGKAGTGDRVRFSSLNGTTIRVQSFMILGSTILDTSQAQGVDFENTTNNRTPANAVDAQPNSQDAINGIAR